MKIRSKLKQQFDNGLSSLLDKFVALPLMNKILFLAMPVYMLSNIEHLAWGYYNVSRHLLTVGGWEVGQLSVPTMSFFNKLHAFGVVVVFEITIMVFSVLGAKGFSLFFTIMLGILNLNYYPVLDYWEGQEWEKLISSIVYSTAFSVGIHMFAHTFSMMIKVNNTLSNIKQLKGKEEQLHTKIKEHNSTIKQRKNDIEQLISTISELEGKIEEKKTEFKSITAKVSAIGRHKTSENGVATEVH